MRCKDDSTTIKLYLLLPGRKKLFFPVLEGEKEEKSLWMLQRGRRKKGVVGWGWDAAKGESKPSHIASTLSSLKLFVDVPLLALFDFH